MSVTEKQVADASATIKSSSFIHVKAQYAYVWVQDEKTYALGVNYYVNEDLNTNEMRIIRTLKDYALEKISVQGFTLLGFKKQESGTVVEVSDSDSEEETLDLTTGRAKKVESVIDVSGNDEKDDFLKMTPGKSCQVFQAYPLLASHGFIYKKNSCYIDTVLFMLLGKSFGFFCEFLKHTHATSNKLKDALVHLKELLHSGKPVSGDSLRTLFGKCGGARFNNGGFGSITDFADFIVGHLGIPAVEMTTLSTTTQDEKVVETRGMVQYKQSVSLYTDVWRGKKLDKEEGMLQWIEKTYSEKITTRNNRAGNQHHRRYRFVGPMVLVELIRKDERNEIVHDTFIPPLTSFTHTTFYELYAVACWDGAHFYCYVREGESWYHYDDSRHDGKLQKVRWNSIKRDLSTRCVLFMYIEKHLMADPFHPLTSTIISRRLAHEPYCAYDLPKSVYQDEKAAVTFKYQELVEKKILTKHFMDSLPLTRVFQVFIVEDSESLFEKLDLQAEIKSAEQKLQQSHRGHEERALINKLQRFVSVIVNARFKSTMGLYNLLFYYAVQPRAPKAHFGKVVLAKGIFQWFHDRQTQDFVDYVNRMKPITL